MIKTFANTETNIIFSGALVKKIDKNLQKLALRKLRYIDAAVSLNDLKIPPANRLEKLKGDLDGFFSVRVNDQFRIIFKWQDGNAFDVEFIDYHRG